MSLADGVGWVNSMKGVSPCNVCQTSDQRLSHPQTELKLSSYQLKFNIETLFHTAKLKRLKFDDQKQKQK